MGFSLEEAARAIGFKSTWRLQIVEEGSDYLTLREAERAAETYERPLSTLFRPAPPNEEAVETQFRRLRDAPALPWSPQMHGLSRRIRARQSAAVELLELQDEPAVWPATAQELATASPTRLPDRLRSRLAVTVAEQRSWAGRDVYHPLRVWISAVEHLGVLVMQDGTMPVSEMRGFAAPHATVPIVVVNTKDDPRARAFTLVHELAHLLLDVTGLAPREGAEVWCNRLASDVLMPSDAFRAVAEATRGPLKERVAVVARQFGVTPLAATVRLARLNMLDAATADDLIADLSSQPPFERPTGGNYFRNKVTWFGPTFTRLVLDAAEDQSVTLSNAAGLLNVKVDHFSKLRAELARRTQAG